MEIEKKDFQYLLLMYEAYIEDMGGEPWKHEKFTMLCEKYGFTKDNISKGFEELFC